MGCSQSVEADQPKCMNSQAVVKMGKKMFKDPNMQIVTLAHQPAPKKKLTLRRSDFESECKAKYELLNNEVLKPLLHNETISRSVFTQFTNSLHLLTCKEYRDQVNQRLMMSLFVPEWIEKFNNQSASGGVGMDRPAEQIPTDFLQSLSELLRLRNKVFIHEKSSLEWLCDAPGPLFLDSQSMDVFWDKENDAANQQCGQDTPVQDRDLFDSVSVGASSVDTGESVEEKTHQYRLQMMQTTFELTGHVLRSPVLLKLLNEQGLDVNSLRSIRHTVSAAVMAAVMEVDSSFPVFIGGESAGKSTLINCLLNPSLALGSKGETDGSEILPTARNMCSQHIAVVKRNRNCKSGVEFKGHPHPGGSTIKDQLKLGAVTVGELRRQKKLNLSTSIAFVRCPFSGAGDCYVDVPGMKAETHHEVALVLAVTGVMVLVAPNLEILKAQLTGQLKDLPKLYGFIAGAAGQTPPPIVLAVTRATKAEFDRDNAPLPPRPTRDDGLNAEDAQLNYEQLVMNFFPTCSSVSVFFANVLDPSVKRETLSADLNSLVLKAPRPLSWQARYKEAKRSCLTFFQTLEKVIGDLPVTAGTVGGGSKVADCVAAEFDKAAVAAEKMVQDMRRQLLSKDADSSLQEWLRDIDPVSWLSNVTEGNVGVLPIYEVLRADGSQAGRHTHKGKFMGQLLNEYNVALAEVLVKLGQEIFDRQWKCAEPLHAIVMDKNDPKLKSRKDPKQMVKNLETYFGTVTEMIHDVVRCEKLSVPNEVVLGQNDFEQAQAYRAEWEQLGNAATGLCSSRELFPYMMAGYVLSISDQICEHVMMAGCGDKDEQDQAQKRRQKESSILEFPSCTKITDFQQHLSDEQERVRGLKKKVKSNSSAGIVRDAVIDSVNKSAVSVVGKIKGSDLFKQRNPLVTRFIEMSTRFLKQGILAYPVHQAQMDTPEPTFTAAAKALIATNASAEVVQDIVEFLNRKQHAEAVDKVTNFMQSLESGRSKPNFRKKRTRVCHYHMSLKKAADNYKKAVETRGNGLEATESIFLVHSFSSDRQSIASAAENILQGFNEVDNNSTTLITNDFPLTSMDDQVDLVISQLKEHKPSTVVLTRRLDAATSTTPSSGEEALLREISRMAFIGTIYVVSPLDLSDSDLRDWERHFGDQKDLVQIMFMPNVEYTKTDGAELIRGDHLNLLGKRIANDSSRNKKNADNRISRAVAVFDEAVGQIGSELNNYINKRKECTPKLIEQWFEVTFREKVEELVRHIPACPEANDIQVPHKSLLHFDPFTEKAGGQVVHHELLMRQFLERSIMLQIMENGKQMGYHVYDNTVKKMLDFVAEVFDADSDSVLDIMISGLRADAQKGSQPKRSLGDPTLFATEFLQREQLSHAYAGGIIYATSPLLTAFLQGSVSMEGKAGYTMKLANDVTRQAHEHLVNVRDLVDIQQVEIVERN